MTALHWNDNLWKTLLLKITNGNVAGSILMKVLMMVVALQNVEFLQSLKIPDNND